MQRSLGAVSSALLALLLASPAMAQVTPEEVWQGWQKMGASYGQAIIAEQVVRNGDTLIVTGMKISMDQDDVQIDGGIDEVRFRDLGDGTVEVTMTDTYAIDMTLPNEDGKSQEIGITLTQPQIKLIAGGNATQTSYVFDAPTMVMDMQVTEDAIRLADVQATLTAVSGNYLLDTQEAMTALDSTMSVDGLSFSVAAGDADNGANVMGTMAALKMASRGNFLGIAAMENMAQALRDGFEAEQIRRIEPDRTFQGQYGGWCPAIWCGRHWRFDDGVWCGHPLSRGATGLWRGVFRFSDATFGD